LNLNERPRPSFSFGIEECVLCQSKLSEMKIHLPREHPEYTLLQTIRELADENIFQDLDLVFE